MFSGKGYMMKINYCGKDAQERMVKNGWTIMLRNYNETPKEMFDRLSERYSKVKVYWTSIMIRGYHDYFAMVKR